MSEEMTFADACIILRKWKELKDGDFVIKRQVEDYVRAMFKLYGERDSR